MPEHEETNNVAQAVYQIARLVGRILVGLFVVAICVTVLALIAMPIILAAVYSLVWILLYLVYPMLLVLIAYYVNNVIQAPESMKGAKTDENN